LDLLSPMMERTPPLREFLCSDSDTREILREAREIVLIGGAEAGAALRQALREFGYRVRISESAALAGIDGRIDIAVLLEEIPPEAWAASFTAARERGVETLWLARGIGDPRFAHAAFRAGFAVIFHRDPAEEYRMHFDDIELGYVAPGGT
jgi:predicted CoA-binding protein